jgi:solute:Na+ symporter, SSS family
MGLSTLDTGIIFMYIIASILLGFWISKKASKGLNSYFLGDNSMKWYMLGFSNSSGMFDISGASFYTSMLVIYGLKSAFVPWLWPIWEQVVVMAFMAAWIRKSGVMTGAEWISFRFGNDRGGRLSHIIIVIFAVIAVVGFIAYFFEGIGKFAANVLPWNLQNDLMTSEQTYATIIIFLTTIYTIKGGMYSVVATEVMQYGIMLVSCVGIAWWAMTHTDIEAVKNSVPENWGRFTPEWQLGLNWSNMPKAQKAVDDGGYNFFGLVIMMMLAKGLFKALAGPVPGFDIQRILSTKSPKEASKMAGFTNLTLFIPLYLMVAGFALIGLYHVLPANSGNAKFDFEQIVSIAIGEHLPHGLKGLVLAGLLAAFMSTFSAFVNAAPAYLVNDFYKKYFKPNLPQKAYIRQSYLVSALVVLLGVIMGFFAGSLNSLTLWLTSGLFGGYTAANFLKWIWWRFNGYGYFWGMVGGLLASTFTLFFKDVLAGYDKETLAYLNGTQGTLVLFFFILVVALIGSLLGTFLTQPTSMETLKQFYHKTNPWGFWKPVCREVQKNDATFVPNRHFKRDVFNVIVGTAWQMSMIVMPMALVFQYWPLFFTMLAIFVTAMIVLRFTWYKKLDEI